jgi:hypothetical protein
MKEYASPVDWSHPPRTIFPDQINGTIRSHNEYARGSNNWYETQWRAFDLMGVCTGKQNHHNDCKILEMLRNISNCQ